MVTRHEEVQQKLHLVRRHLTRGNPSVVAFRNASWFSWITAGGSSRVLMGAEQGVAEVYVTVDAAFVVTDNIEAERLEREELPQDCFEVMVFPWTQFGGRAAFLRSLATPPRVASDAPAAHELPLPAGLLEARRVMCAGETERFTATGLLAAEAMTEVMLEARGDWTEERLASEGSEALLRRGLVPEVILVAGEDRLPLYRHPVPTRTPLKRRAMMVFCAQRHGLVANLTRFVEFGALGNRWKRQHEAVQRIEGDILEASRPGVTLDAMYQVAARAYSQHGFTGEIRQHHQGGIGGYRPREVLAAPEVNDTLEGSMVLAWNPSLPGAKIEDSFLLHADGSLKNLTLDPRWPTVNVNGRPRPQVLETP